MSIQRDDVEHVAELARLKLTPTERDRFTEQLQDILGYVDQLNELDTTNLEPVVQVNRIPTKLREDEVAASGAAEGIFGQAPDAERGYFRVPRIVETGELRHGNHACEE